ncbi:hypothetical protein EYF80_008816 [Liparis tanakae]|uniref:Uncharacterized protein n=1 Tax=Liparis tanakae TaxID=230148 RepID=A0A4Z2ISK1_9TELE|nr:hypothetical protein EYF80_008816 [Liparis tanakae]
MQQFIRDCEVKRVVSNVNGAVTRKDLGMVVRHSHKHNSTLSQTQPLPDGLASVLLRTSRTGESQDGAFRFREAENFSTGQLPPGGSSRTLLASAQQPRGAEAVHPSACLINPTTCHHVVSPVYCLSSPRGRRAKLTEWGHNTNTETTQPRLKQETSNVAQRGPLQLALGALCCSSVQLARIERLLWMPLSSSLAARSAPASTWMYSSEREEQTVPESIVDVSWIT